MLYFFLIINLSSFLKCLGVNNQLNLITQELTVVKISIKALLSHQGLVIARFNNAPMIHDNDLLSIANRRQTMGHDKTGPILLISFMAF